MVFYNDVVAAIHVNGQPLPEFQIEKKDSEKAVSCWVPCYSGKEFVIRVRNASPSSLMRLEVKMDGVLTNIRCFRPGEEEVVDKCRPSPTTYQYFTFSQGQLVDDDELPGQSSNVAGLGTIAVTVYYVKLLKETSSGRDYRKIDIPNQREIPEREKKGVQDLGRIEHRVPSTRRPPKSKVLGTAVKFIFRYRPLAYLEAQGIAPPSQTSHQTSSSNPRKRKGTNVAVNPRPSKGSRKSAKHKEVGQPMEISDEEDVEKLTALRARIDKALEKKGVQATQVKKEVKTEPRTLPFAKGEVIDLT